MKILLSLIISSICFLACNTKQSKNIKTSIDEITVLKELTLKWDSCIENKDPKTLEGLYAEQILFYGKEFSKTGITKIRNDFYKTFPDFHQSIEGEIRISKITSKRYKAAFNKTSIIKGKTSRVRAYLIFDQDGDEWKISAESDETTDKNLIKIQKSEKPKIGESIWGDFDGDGSLEKAETKIIKEGIFDEEPFQLSVNFSSDKVKSLPISCDRNWIYFINEGDLDGIAGDELSIYSPPNHGCTYNIQTYTFKNGSWKELFDMFPVLTFCYEISDEDLQKRVFREENQVYYLNTISDEDTFKLVKTKAVLK